MSKQRIIDLQKQVRIARTALERIKAGTTRHQSVAEEAINEMWKLEQKQPLQYLVGHERPPHSR